MVKIKRLKSPRYTKCNLTCHLRKVKDPLSLQEKRKLPCIECLNDSIMLPMCPMDPLLITDRQGLIEIHISRLQLSTSVSISHTFSIVFCGEYNLYVMFIEIIRLQIFPTKKIYVIFTFT